MPIQKVIIFSLLIADLAEFNREIPVYKKKGATKLFSPEPYRIFSFKAINFIHKLYIAIYFLHILNQYHGYTGC